MLATSESSVIESVIFLSISCKIFLLSSQPQNMNRYLTVWVLVFFSASTPPAVKVSCYLFTVSLCQGADWWKDSSEEWELAYDPWDDTLSLLLSSESHVFLSHLQPASCDDLYLPRHFPSSPQSWQQHGGSVVCSGHCHFYLSAPLQIAAFSSKDEN